MSKNKKHNNKHHLRPRSRGGSSVESNLLTINEDKHCLLHKIFGNLTWNEIIILMIRIAKEKHYENNEPKVKVFYKFLN
jgi:hypothetical protein